MVASRTRKLTLLSLLCGCLGTIETTLYYCIVSHIDHIDLDVFRRVLCSYAER